MQKNEIAGTFCVSDFLRAAGILLDEKQENICEKEKRHMSGRSGIE